MNSNILLRYKEEIEAALNEYMPAVDTKYSKVVDAARYSLLMGGKRLRPSLCLTCYSMIVGEHSQALPFAVALEMIHTYSLIHDDLPCMDDDDMRRGAPSNHKKFGEDVALLAGDALLTHAFITALKTDSTVIPANKIIECMKILSESAGANGMIGGQMLDISNQTKNLSDLECLHSLKTGALINASCLIGATLAGACEDTLGNVKTYAENIGLVFQIIDDILDVTSTAEQLGKPIGSDKKIGKTTYVTLLGVDGASEQAKILTDAAIKAISKVKNSENLIEIAKILYSRKH